jgi:hypothetical protein
MIQIKKSNTADTRTCDWSKVSKEQLLESSLSHIGDVGKGLEFFRDRLKEAFINHDYTKIKNIDEFYRDFQTGFKTTEWWQMHQRDERHHLKEPRYVQPDVNLIDILEMITDCVMAGMARSGEYRHEEIPDSLLREAFNNTVKLLLKNVEVLK